MKNLRVKVMEQCAGGSWVAAIFDGKKHLTCKEYKRKYAATKRAKVLAKIVGIPFDPKIVKQHGC